MNINKPNWSLLTDTNLNAIMRLITNKQDPDEQHTIIPKDPLKKYVLTEYSRQ